MYVSHDPTIRLKLYGFVFFRAIRVQRLIVFERKLLHTYTVVQFDNRKVEISGAQIYNLFKGVCCVSRRADSSDPLHILRP